MGVRLGHGDFYILFFVRFFPQIILSDVFETVCMFRQQRLCRDNLSRGQQGRMAWVEFDHLSPCCCFLTRCVWRRIKSWGLANDITGTYGKTSWLPKHSTAQALAA